MDYKKWAKEYLQQANVMKAKIKQLKQNLKSAPDNQERQINARIYLLYQMYLDCKHVGDFLDRRAKVQAMIEQERRVAANGKTCVTFGYVHGKHSWSTTVSISK